MRMNMAVIGGGMVSRVHLQALLAHPGVQSVWMAENNPLELEKLKAEFNLKGFATDYHALLDRPEIDTVDICLPHDLHYPVVLEALAAGKHVILEKPIANSLAEADEMINAAEQAGKRFYVALNERYLPIHRRVRELIDEGAFGKLLMAVLTIAGSELERMQQPGHWKGTIGRAGGGALADSGTHLVDVATYWFGEPTGVEAVLGRYVVQAANKAEDTASVLLRYPDMMVTLAVTYASAGQPWSERRSIWGQRGSAHIQVEATEALHVWQDGKLIPQVVEHQPDRWWAYSVQLGLKAALDCFAADTPFPVEPQDARRVLKVIRAAYRSAWLQRQVAPSEVESPLFETGVEVGQ